MGASYRASHLHIPSFDFDKVEKMFGSIPHTCYVLFQTMLGGVSWGVVSDTLLEFDIWSAALYFFYIAFTMLAVLNIITGIFVDNALETSRMQRDYIVAREEKARHKAMKEFSKIFDEMDEDASGSITWEEMAGALENPATNRYFHALGLKTEDMRQLFSMIDDNGSGQIDLQDFLDGCSRCTGDAKSIDIHAILHDIKRLHKRLDLEGFAHSAGATESDNPHSSVAELKRMATQVQQLASQVTGSMSGWSRALAIEFKQLKGLSRFIMQKIDLPMQEDQSAVEKPETALHAGSDGFSSATFKIPSLPRPLGTPEFS